VLLLPWACAAAAPALKPLTNPAPTTLQFALCAFPAPAMQVSVRASVSLASLLKRRRRFPLKRPSLSTSCFSPVFDAMYLHRDLPDLAPRGDRAGFFHAYLRLAFARSALMSSSISSMASVLSPGLPQRLQSTQPTKTSP
jgi:hypothetical protein